MVYSMRQLAFAAALATTAHGFSISVPSSITAGKDFALTATTNSSDSGYSYYRVYLDTTPPGYTGGPSCYLVNQTSTSTTSLTLNIPPAFGPDGDFYSIAVKEFPGGNTYATSNDFNLTGATGNWSNYENNLKGAPLWPADDLPCTAYSCARSCAEKSFPGDETGNTADYDAMATCIIDCTGVSIPTTSSIASAILASATASGASSVLSASSAAAASASATGSGTHSASHSGTASATGASSTFTGAAAATNIASAAMLAAGGVFAMLI